MNAPAPAPPRLGWPTKALYSFGSLGTATRASLMGAVLFFYNRVLGVDAQAVSFAIFIALLIDAFWDPIVGQISDGTRTRLGRRHPFVYAAVLPASVCFALIFMPPLAWSDDALFFYLLATLVGARILESLIEIPMASLLPELSRDYDERTSLGSWRYIFLAVFGRALATILAYGVFLKGTKAQPFGQMNLAGYAPYAVTVAVISIAATLISALATQRFVPQCTNRRANDLGSRPCSASSPPPRATATSSPWRCRVSSSASPSGSPAGCCSISSPTSGACRPPPCCSSVCGPYRAACSAWWSPRGGRDAGARSSAA
jgi:Na+/melibiose symporter-like transporter